MCQLKMGGWRAYKPYWSFLISYKYVNCFCLVKIWPRVTSNFQVYITTLFFIVNDCVEFLETIPHTQSDGAIGALSSYSCSNEVSSSFRTHGTSHSFPAGDPVSEVLDCQSSAPKYTHMSPFWPSFPKVSQKPLYFFFLKLQVVHFLSDHKRSLVADVGIDWKYMLFVQKLTMLLNSPKHLP